MCRLATWLDKEKERPTDWITLLRRLGRPLPRRWRRIAGRILFDSSDRRRDLTMFRTSLRSTDVFLVGHPKSGNTWVAYMLAIVLEDGDTQSHVNLANVGDFVPIIHGTDSQISRFGALRDPRIFRNEWPVYPEHYPKTLYLVRDPRAVLVSYYHHYRVVTGDDATSLDSFIDMYLRDGCIRSWEPRLVRWDRQVAQWTGHAGPSYVVKYESLHEDRRDVLEAIVRFCGFEPANGVIAAAVERGGFGAMRDVEGRSGAESYPNGLQRRGRFLRRGRVDGWREELSPGAREAIESEFRPVMQQMGYAIET